MASIENPPAFPHGALYSGMTLRDYFAGQALMQMLLRPDWNYTESERQEGQPKSDAAGVASTVYRYADAMLAARQGEQS